MPPKSKINTRAIKKKATKEFTDREEPQKSFAENYNKLLEKKDFFKILVFYGFGGLGKTALLKHLNKKSKSENEINIFINLESEQYYSIFEIFLDIRSKFPPIKEDFRLRSDPFLLFEYSLYRLYAMQGKKFDEIQKSWSNEGSLIYEIIDFTSEVPGAFISKGIKFIGEKINRNFGNNKQELENIDTKSEEELKEWIPVYFGESIKNYLTIVDKKLLLFFDTLEYLDTDPKFRDSKHENDWWLKELLINIENGLFIFSSREKNRWAEENSDWHNDIEQHILGVISDNDAKGFLKKVPIEDQDVINEIIKTSDGIPLYLDLCVETYIRLKENDEKIDASYFRTSQKEVVRRLLQHLNKNEQELAIALALTEKFNYDIFETVNSYLNLNYSNAWFSDLTELSIISEINVGEKIYKIHDVVRENIIESLVSQNGIYIDKVLFSLMTVVKKYLNNNNTLNLSWIYEQLLVILKTSADLNISVKPEKLFMILWYGIQVIDRGKWSEVLNSIEKVDTNVEVQNKHMLFFYGYLKAYCYRKKGLLYEAKNIYESIQAYKIPEFEQLFAYHQAHLSHLLGNYNYAANKYETIVKIYPIGEQNTYAFSLAKRQLGDIKLISGEFTDALNIFQDIMNTYSDPLWLAENNRFIGHVYRFNFALDSAMEFYYKAEKYAKQANAYAMLGKIYTNFAETLCWSDDRSLAIEYAEKAIEINDAVSSLIEVGKALSAKSIALTFNNEYDEAMRVAEESFQIQSKAGYKSGSLFALNAMALCYLAQKDRKKSSQKIMEMKNIIKEIGVYQHLPFALEYILNDDPKHIISSYNNIKWLNIDKLSNKLNSIFFRILD